MYIRLTWPLTCQSSETSVKTRDNFCVSGDVVARIMSLGFAGGHLWSLTLKGPKWPRSLKLPRSLTAHPWKMMVGVFQAALPFWDTALLSVAMLNFRGIVNYPSKNSQKWWTCLLFDKNVTNKNYTKAIQCLQCFGADYSSCIDCHKGSMTANHFDHVQHPDLWRMSQPTGVQKKWLISRYHQS